ncbi:hypothetical protein SLEP1_g3782 [Rubroshorea leprosula]|uniref:Uncharacterized protein n=1 Tax=Rubroshorea leprosula TaxID=152421 RepID=A0AAV5HW83_9ROSI|nr:hypothetical protein SLEP1_g3782 [Rubroshorea leprosula]
MVKFRALCICGTFSQVHVDLFGTWLCLELGWPMDFRTMVR